MKKINKNNLVVLTMGDPSGIGTEITIKSWKSKKTKAPFFLIHDPIYVQKIIKKMGVKVDIKIIHQPIDAISQLINATILVVGARFDFFLYCRDSTTKTHDRQRK